MARARTTAAGSGQAFSDDPQVERSLRHSVRDGVYFSAMTGSAESYFSAFAVLLRATPAQIGVLASVPPLLAAFLQLFSAWLGRRLGRRRPIIVAGALLQAATLVPIALLAFQRPGTAGPDGVVLLLLIALVSVYFWGPNIGSPQWGSLMGDIVPASRRGRFFALRTRMCSIASFSGLVGAGLVIQGFDWLDATAWGFFTVFATAALLRLASAWHLQQMHDPPGHVAALESPWHAELWRDGRATHLLRFSVFFACMQFAVAIASPFFTLYLLRDLEMSYVAFTLNMATSVCVQFLTLTRWGRLSDLFGNRLILVATGILIPLLPMLWLFSTAWPWLIVVQALSGLAWAGFSLSASNFIYELTPPERRATLMAVHGVLAAVGVFLGALLGGWLGTHLPTTADLFGWQVEWLTPLYGVFLLSSVARAVVVLAFVPHLEEVRSVRRMSVTGLIFRVTRIHSGSGMMFEIVSRRRRDEPDD